MSWRRPHFSHFYPHQDGLRAVLTEGRFEWVKIGWTAHSEAVNLPEGFTLRPLQNCQLLNQY